MPFQAIPLALRANTGSPVTKLALIYLVNEARIDCDPPNGKAFVECDVRELSIFCQVTIEEAHALIDELARQRWVELIRPAPGDPDHLFLDFHLPISQLQKHERKRFKASPDQLERLVQLADYRCATCGVSSFHEEVTWHADHIIPQSVGGADVEENMQVICARCNQRKHAKIHFVDYLGGRK